MTKTKKLITVVLIALVVVTPLFALTPLLMGRASADASTPYDNASTEQQVQAFIYIRAMTNCLKNSSLRDEGKVGTQVEREHVNNFEWFANAGNLFHQDNITAYTGYLNPDKGQTSCNKSDWIKSMYGLLGGSNSKFSSDNGLTDLCYSGFRRKDAKNGQSAADCISDTKDGTTFSKDNSPSAAVTAFLTNVNKQYFGRPGASQPTLTAPMKYVLYSKSFINLCKAKLAPDQSNVSLIPADKRYTMTTVDENTGKTTSPVYSADKSQDEKPPIYTERNYKPHVMSCADLAKQASANAAAYATLVQAGVTNDAGNTPDASTTPDTSCGDRSWVLKVLNPLDWLTCAIVGGFGGVAENLDNGIMSLLCVDEGDIFAAKSTCGATAVSSTDQSTTSQAFHSAWNGFRLISLGVIVIAGLLMVISQGLGFEIFDAYTVKKTLPRILIAGIGISLSWQIMQFMVTLSNGLGIGIRALIYSPFKDAGINTVVLQGGGSAIVSIFAVGSFVSLGALGLLSFVGTALLAAMIAFVMLIIRYMLVILLIIIAPVAIAMYALPNTEKHFKTWWDWLLKTLMIFPFITGLIAVGHVFAAITSLKAQSMSNSGAGLFTSFVAFVAYFAPYFAIPFAFRIAGGAIGTLGGLVNDRSRGGFDRLKKFRGNRMATNAQAMKNFSRFSENTMLGRGANNLLGAGANPVSMMRGRKGVQAKRSALQTVHGQDLIKNSPVWQGNQFDDNFHLAVANRELAQRKIASQQRALATETDADKRVAIQSDIDARQRGMEAAMQIPWNQRNTRAMKIASLDALTKTGYQFSPGQQGYDELTETVDKISGNDRLARTQLMDQSQFNLKGAGRPELAGINHGATNDAKGGIRKLNNYTRGQGKTDLYHGGAEAWLGNGVVGADGKTLGDVKDAAGNVTEKAADRMATGMQAALADPNSGVTLESLAEWHTMLANDYGGANDANKLEIDKQMAAISRVAGSVRAGSGGAMNQAQGTFYNTVARGNQIKDRGPYIDPSERA